jgi:4-hydroxyacetophenone monooxygenase
MTARPELLDASDAVIEDAVQYADPMVLRGLLYQLTGDESLKEVPVAMVHSGFFEVAAIERPQDTEMIRQKAADFLKRYRDSGAGEIAVDSDERLRTSLAMAAGFELADSEFDMWVEELALDQFARGIKWTAETPPGNLEDFSVAVIGAGMGGLNAAVMLKQAGIPFTVFEKNLGVGGTWHENRYPGARVDSPSRTYTHIFGVDFPYPNPFCAQVDNEKYFQWIANEFALSGNIEFDTEVTSLAWSENDQRWRVSVRQGGQERLVEANAVISCVGYLSRANLPEFEGQTEFAGPVFHTSRWPADLDLTGRRVAVVGTGCTGYQLVPELAKQAGHTVVFQRTPSWVFDVPGYLDPFPPQVNWLDRNFPFMTNFVRFRAKTRNRPESLLPAYAVDPDFHDEFAVSAVNKRIRDQRIEFMRSKFAGRPDLLEKMLPVAPPMSSRPVLVDQDYSIYDALQREDVELVSTRIERFTRTGIVTADGAHHEVDAVVLATGFRANDFLWPMEVRGRGGQRIEELWAKDGPRAYVGAMLPGFPNFFMVYGPNTNPIGGLQVVDVEEIVTRFALECVRGLVESGRSSVDVTQDAYWRYNAEVDRIEKLRTYMDRRVRNYYQNDFGRSSGMMSIDVRLFWHWLRSPVGRLPATELPPLEGELREVEQTIRPYFGQDLVIE